MDCLTEFNYKVHHKLCKTNVIKITDKLSQMPRQYSQFAVAANLEQIALITTRHSTKSPNKQLIDSSNDGFKQEAQSHRLYWDSKWYRQIISLLLNEEKILKNCRQTEKRAIRQAALKYKIAGRYLVHLNCGGKTAKCVLPNKVDGILKWTHNKYKHFLNPFMLYKLQRQWFWLH